MFSSVHVRSTLIGEKVFPTGKTEGLNVGLGLRVYVVERLVKLATTQCPPLPRGARIGEVPQAEGFVVS